MYSRGLYLPFCSAVNPVMDTMQISCDEFLTNLERLLKKCTKKATDYEDKEELRSGLSDLVLIFTKSDPAFKEIMLKFLSTVKCQLISLLIDFILQEFQGQFHVQLKGR